MHIPFTPNHVQLVSACYPPSAALLTAAPDYRPNSQELSRLTYYAANRPEKISKLGSELAKRVKTDCAKAREGNTRARASLLITLAIFKALATECRREIALLSPPLVSSVSVTLSALSTDLEIAARAATVFTAWTTYTDGHLVGADRKLTEEYLSCLQSFARMSHIESADHETRNRCRLVGLAALVGAVNSEALYHSATQFQRQVAIVVSAFLKPLLQVDVHVLEREIDEIKEQPTSPILEGFRTRPALERRATSIHIHIDGEQGPSSADVANTAMRGISSLLAHANGSQAATVIKACIDGIDSESAWNKRSHCELLVERAAEWTQYQYRYGIPSRLVECLAEGQDTVDPSPRNSTLAAMITTVFRSPTPLVNLSTSDIISSLISILLRRISVTPEDALLPALVECISSLGTHVYYADQTQDLAAELISRLVIIETGGIPGSRSLGDDLARSQALRCLLAGLLGLIRAADMHDSGKEVEGAEEKDAKKLGTSATLPPADVPSDGHLRPSRRTKVGPSIWQDTITLLCDGDFSVRADYAAALVSYIEKEIPKLGDQTDADGVKRPRPLAEGPAHQANTAAAMLYGDSTMRFLHALHAHVYALATSPKLGLLHSSTSISSSPEPAAERNSDPRDSRTSTHPSRSRRTSLVRRVLKRAPARVAPSARVAANLSDLGNALAILSAVQEGLPVRALFTGVPMLLTLNAAVSADIDGDGDGAARQHLRAIKEVVAKTWVVIGRVWSCPAITEMAEKALSSMVPPAMLPDLQGGNLGKLQQPLEPVAFPEGVQDIQLGSELDAEVLLGALAASASVQHATGLSDHDLLKKLRAEWTPEVAHQDSLETKAKFDTIGGDGLSPLIKVAPTPMQVENMSMQSLARSGRGGVGVTDLREALEGRSSMSNPNLAGRVPSISTLDHTVSTLPGTEGGFARLTPSRSRPQQRAPKPRPGEVRDVLNRLGIGMQSGGALLKTSFPAMQRAQSRNPPTFTPPYKT